MGFVDKSEVFQFKFWFTPEFLGEQWGIGVHDIDGNGFLDFYANHHGQPTGEIIMNFASGSPESIFFEIPGDLHGVTFFDVDQDGDADMLQAHGGRFGAAENPDDPTLWNKVLLNEDGVISTTNSVGDFGLEYALGRRRLLTPVNFDGDLAIFAGVSNDRADGSYPGEFLGRDATGSYSLIAPVGDGVSGELAKGVHFGTDRFVDVVNLDWRNNELGVYENRGAGFDAGVQLSLGARVTDLATGDFDGDLVTEILFSRVKQRDGLLRQDASGDWVDVSDTAIPARGKDAQTLVTGDFDNDGDLDYVALMRQDGVEVRTYLNRGDGTFENGPVFHDATISGRGDHMISGDFNRDGVLDLIVTTSASVDAGLGSRPGSYVLLEGEPTDNNWLSIALSGTVSETGGLGARVFVTTPDGKVRVLEQDSGAHFAAQNATDLHFGLGANAVADVRIVWPDGFSQTVAAVAANQHVVLTEQRDVVFAAFFDGTDAAEALRGSKVADLIRGREGGDVLSARRGADALFGGDGDDRLFGGADDDMLIGGGGVDTMTGGSGADAFVFTDPADSAPGARRDAIRDFELGIDTLDLSRIDANAVRSGAQAFAFIDAAAFSGTAGELRVQAGVVEGDVDGDAIGDFQIEIRNRADLGESAFVL